MFRDQWIMLYEYGDEHDQFAKVTYADGEVVMFTDMHDIIYVFNQFRTQFTTTWEAWKKKHDLKALAVRENR